jgi:hypothetical protein
MFDKVAEAPRIGVRECAFELSDVGERSTLGKVHYLILSRTVMTSSTCFYVMLPHLRFSLSSFMAFHRNSN